MAGIAVRPPAEDDEERQVEPYDREDDVGEGPEPEHDAPRPGDAPAGQNVQGERKRH
jgi:hypothetical protein